MISLEDFHQDFMQQIIVDAESRQYLRSEIFLEKAFDILTSVGELTPDRVFAHYKKIGVEVHGFDYDQERRILTLITADFSQNGVIETLSSETRKAKFSRLKNFYTKISQKFYEKMEETDEAYEMGYQIYNLVINSQIDRIRLFLISDKKTPRVIKDLPVTSIEGIPVSSQIIDINYIYQIHKSENSNSDFEINATLPSLCVSNKTNNYDSYLVVVPGDFIVDIYEKHGKKLFEQNVRTFLQFRGKINKGIRNTIETNPEMFFAYNNGLTATATNISFANGIITKIENLQIVNGGQTTSAIYASHKNHKLDVSKVFIQMKLSVINTCDSSGEFVSKVSEYANTQNKVNKSDFFSNSPFHKEFKDYSNRIWVSPKNGSQNRTRWFYERVRGEYLNEQAYLSKSEKNSFMLQNPKKQLIDKNFLSRSEISWKMLPYIVAKGASYSFDKFAEITTKQIDKDQFAITEKFYKDAISRVIMFRALENIVSKATWYERAFRAQTVTYSLAYFSYLVSQKRRSLNFELIWQEQELPHELKCNFAEISKEIYTILMNPPKGYANVGQWCKREECWEDVKKQCPKILISPSLLLNKEDEIIKNKKSKEDKKLTSGIEIQTFVVKQNKNVWDALYLYFQRDDTAIIDSRIDVLKSMVDGRMPVPSEKQSKILYELYNTANSEEWKI